MALPNYNTRVLIDTIPLGNLANAVRLWYEICWNSCRGGAPRFHGRVFPLAEWTITVAAGSVVWLAVKIMVTTLVLNQGW
jgi:hypothetical protein